ncbi:Imm1 family immunity protein [Streptomyces sp. NPDC018338]|uniref:Imm1 family immunity protein n=1 Tax=Streptomyces sp. NPDC018338 TaxID=3157192 RepID=UPI003405B7E7
MSESVKAEAVYLSAHCGKPAEIFTPDDVDKMIDDLAVTNSPYGSSGTLAQVFSTERERLEGGHFDHELIVGVDGDTGFGVLTFMDEHGNFATVGSPDTREEPIYTLVHHMRELPEHCEISAELVRAATKEFIANGGQRPTCVEWKPEW